MPHSPLHTPLDYPLAIYPRCPRNLNGNLHPPTPRPNSMIIHHRKHLYPRRHTIFSRRLSAHQLLERGTRSPTNSSAGVKSCDTYNTDGNGEDERGKRRCRRRRTGSYDGIEDVTCCIADGVAYWFLSFYKIKGQSLWLMSLDGGGMYV